MVSSLLRFTIPILWTSRHLCLMGHDWNFDFPFLSHQQRSILSHGPLLAVGHLCDVSEFWYLATKLKNEKLSLHFKREFFIFPAFFLDTRVPEE